MIIYGNAATNTISESAGAIGVAIPCKPDGWRPSLHKGRVPYLGSKYAVRPGLKALN